MENVKYKSRRQEGRQGESGNVLFLILIAVALFAALSYAVTQSTRSGGGDANKEKSSISGAQITQYPAGIRSAVVRMIIGNTDVADLSFNQPSDFAALGGNTAWGVFNPSGGGATYERASNDVMSGGGQGTWHFNSENEINLIGTTVGGDSPNSSTADIIAFLPGISLSVCAKLNEELGLPTTPPVETGIDVTTDMVAVGGTAPGIGAGGATIGEGGASALDGQPFGCFELTAASGNYVYYHVLLER